jgi:multiple sugar transport system substrate-binding protein
MDNSAPIPPNTPQPIAPPSANQGAVYKGGSPIKKILLIVVAILVVLLLIGGVFLLIRPKQSGPVTLTYWGLWEDAPIYQSVISQYEKEHPGVTIKYEKQDVKNAPGGYVSFLKSRMRSDTGPDVFRFHPSWMLFIKDYMAPFSTSAVNSMGLKDQFFKSVSEDMVYKGAYYGVPVGYDQLVLFVNDDILQAGGYSVPSDWGKFVDTARALTVVDDQTGEIKTSGAALGTYNNIAHASDILSLFMVQNGVNINSLVGYTGKTDQERIQLQKAAKQKMADVFDFYTCFATSRDDAGCTPVWDQNMPNSKLAFVQGKLAFYFGYSWDILEIQKTNPDLKFSLHPVPRLDNKDPQSASLSNYWAEGVSAYSPHQKEAMDFLAYLSKQESLEQIFKAQAAQRPVAVAYPRKSMSPLLKDNKYLSVIANNGENAHSMYFYSDTFGGGDYDSMNVYLENALNSIITQQISAASAVDTFATGLSKTFSAANSNANTKTK